MRIYVPILILAFLLLTAGDKITACTTSISPPHYVVQNAEVIVRAVPEEAVETYMVKFRITEVIKGLDVPPFLLIQGSLSDKDLFNPGKVPYWGSRSTGGLCHNYVYKKGGEYLLLMKNINGVLTPYWRALAPTNEQLHSAGDGWTAWVKAHLDWLDNATELEKMAEIDFELFKREGFNTDGELLWRYYFIGGKEGNLRKLAGQLESQGYIFFKLSKPDNTADSEKFELQMQKIERHSPATLLQRNKDLRILALTYGIKSYRSWMMGGK